MVDKAFYSMDRHGKTGVGELMRSDSIQGKRMGLKRVKQGPVPQTSDGWSVGSNDDVYVPV